MSSYPDQGEYMSSLRCKSRLVGLPDTCPVTALIRSWPLGADKFTPRSTL